MSSSRVPGSSPLAAVIVALALGTFAWACVAPASAPAAGASNGVALALAGLSARAGVPARALAWVGVSGAIILGAPLPKTWPIVQVVALLPALLAALALTAPSGERAWLRAGRVEPRAVVAIGLLAALALPLWVTLARPDLTGPRAMLPAWSPTLLILAALGFAIVNAALEELLFRGLVQGALERLLGPGWAALLLQAALFGVAHWGGFPSGPLGVLMAGSWALLLGWARRRGGGLLTPTLAHVVADLVIFASLAWAS